MIWDKNCFLSLRNFDPKPVLPWSWVSLDCSQLFKSQGHQKWKLHITQLFCEYPFIVILSLFVLSFLVKTILKTIEDYHWKYIFCSTILVFGLFFFVLFVLHAVTAATITFSWKVYSGNRLINEINIQRSILET